jgi:hypothetical protein
MKKLILTLLLPFLSATVYADGNYGCVMNVSGGFNWENGTWKLSNFHKENILISIQGNGSKLKYKQASNTFESEYVCTLSKFYDIQRKKSFDFLNCKDDFGGMVVFDEVTLKGGESQLNGSLTRSNQYKDSLSVREFTCQRF